MGSRARLGLLLLPLALLAALGIGAGIGRATAPGTATSGQATTNTTTANLLDAPTESQLKTVEIGFAADMLDHHDQIIELATFAATHANTDAVKSMAFGIVASQQYEKGLLESYLRARGVSRPTQPDRQVMAWMGTPMPLESMPGYIAKADVIALFNLEGGTFDKRFLEITVLHHEGGVHMAKDIANRTPDPWLKSIASKMVVSQQEEINDASSFLSGTS